VRADRLLDHTLDVGFAADVGDDRGRRAAGRADLVRRALAAMGLQLGDANLGALAGEEKRDAAADALARTRDERNPTGEPAQRVLLARRASG